MERADKKIKELRIQFRKKRRPVVFDFRSFCLEWNWARRSDIYTHYLHRYPAKLIPYIPIFFLSTTLCEEDGLVMDPFAGSGTVLLESIVHPYHKRNCIGIEINPLARLITKVKTTPLQEDILNQKKQHLFSTIKNNSGHYIVPDYKNLSLWFSKSAQRKLGRIRACIENLEDDNYKDFFFVCFSSIIRAVALADPNIPPPVVLNPKKYRKVVKKYLEMRNFLKRNQNPNVIKLFKESIRKNENRVKSLNGIEEVYRGEVKAKIVWDDSREPKLGKVTNKGLINKKGARKFADNSIGLMISSPPYITAQKYIRTTKLELLWLGLANSDELGNLDRKTIGTERIKATEEIQQIGIKTIDNIFNKIARVSTARAIMVSKYFNEMGIVMRNLYRVLKRNGRLILIVGNNRVCGYPIETYKLLTVLGEDIGFEVELIVKDRIRSRGMITKRHANGGLIKDEFIVMLKK